MKITFWGSRGSIPVSGKNYIKYGGDTPCVEIRTKNDEVIIIDAGTGIRNLGNKLLLEKKTNLNIFFTHAHWDHLMGFPFFKPIYFKNYNIEILGCEYSQSSIRYLLSNVMNPPFFPVNLDELKSTIKFTGKCFDSTTIDSVTIDTISLNHPNTGLGFRFTDGNKRFVFLTDNEIGLKDRESKELAFNHETARSYDEYLEFARKADLLVHDAEYTPDEYKNKISWGHSSYRDALDFAIEAEVRHFGMYHHNQDRTDTEIDAMATECSETLNGRKIKMKCYGIRQGTTIQL